VEEVTIDFWEGTGKSLCCSGLFTLGGEPKEGTQADEVRWRVERFATFLEGVFEKLPFFFKVLPSVGVQEGLEAREAGSHGDRVSGESSRLVDRTCWGAEIHEFGPSGEGPNREPATDDFAKSDQVWGDSIMRAGTTLA
jgi:hypothetical protein